MHWLKRYTSRRLHSLSVKFRVQYRLLKELGLRSYLLLVVRKRVGKRGAIYDLKARHANHSLCYRLKSSDLFVFHQIFIDLEYGPLKELQDVRLIIDCGANVGYSSAFFLSQFPSSHVIAVEPDIRNFVMLQRNLSEYGSRATAIRAGIWSHNVPLRVSQERYRDGLEWSVQVQPCDADQAPDFQGVTIQSLLDSSRVARISLLKIDIEGAEAVVFQGNVDWLDRVDAIAIELHDDTNFGKATEIFDAAIRSRGFEISYSGELTICRRPKTLSHPIGRDRLMPSLEHSQDAANVETR